MGLVISGYAKFGDNFCDCGPAVDGLGRVAVPSTPVRDNHVDIGATAKLRVGILIGNSFLIDATAVVIRSVPETAIALGVPAVVKSRGLSA